MTILLGSELFVVVMTLVAALNLWAVIVVVQSDMTHRAKILWVALILSLPMLGFFAWTALGARSDADPNP